MILNISYEDGQIFVELNNGLNFYGLFSDPLKTHGMEERAFKYGCSGKLNRLNEIAVEQFEAFLQVLIEQFVSNIYERKYHLTKSDIILDLGAHFGVFTVKAATEVGDEGRVIAIEPEKDNLALLQKNIEANSLKNVMVVPKGVWNKRDKMKLYLANGVHVGHSLVSDRVERDKFIEIEVDTLDNILEELGITRVDFIKMDIEGAEIEALKGMSKTLKTIAGKLAIATDRHMVEGKFTREAVIRQLRETEFKTSSRSGTVYAKKS